MSIKVGVTRPRMMAAAAFFIVATAILAIAGVDLKAYLMGVAVGIGIVALITWLAVRRKRGSGT